MYNQRTVKAGRHMLFWNLKVNDLCGHFKSTCGFSQGGTCCIYRGTFVPLSWGKPPLSIWVSSVLVQMFCRFRTKESKGDGRGIWPHACATDSTFTYSQFFLYPLPHQMCPSSSSSIYIPPHNFHLITWWPYGITRKEDKGPQNVGHTEKYSIRQNKS